MEVSPLKSGIPAGSMDLTCSGCQQKGGQHGPRTEKIKKLLTLLEQPSCLTVSSGELKNRVFPWFFTQCEPIRRCRLRSHDSHAGFQQSDARASQWW